MSAGRLLALAGTLLFIQAAHPLGAQTLSLSSGTASASGAVSLNLSFSSSGPAIATLQWTLNFPAASVPTLTAAAGPALTAAGKSLSCTRGAGSYTCIAYGLNAIAIGNGVVAVISATASQSAPVTVTNYIAANPAGDFQAITATGGTITVPSPTAVLSSLSCNPTSLTGPGSSTCTVALSGAATAATAVSLSSNNTAVVVPQSVTVASGSTSAQFSAVSSSSLAATVTLTATLNSTSKTATLTLNATTLSLHVNAGGPAYTDPSGNRWSADANFAGGATSSVTNSIANTTAPSLYQSCRWGAFTYTWNVPDGSYDVTLKFAEISHSSAGARQFNVSINGTQVLTNFDIYAKAGGEYIALDKTFPANVTGGQIAIQFSYGTADAPMVNAIDIEPAVAAPSSVRLNSGGPAYTDPSGNLWSADAGYAGGSTFTTGSAISGTATAALYQTCRWGAFTYTVKVPNGGYGVTLKFAEVSRFGVGLRQFNVTINGAAVLSNFDIFAQAGGAFIALDKTFQTTVNSGQIVIQFSYGEADAPMVNGIDIEPTP